MTKRTTKKTKPDAPVFPLTMRPKEVAKALSLSERKLWEITNRGLIPHFHVGKAVMYSVNEIHQWIEEQSRPANGQRQRERAKRNGSL